MKKAKLPYLTNEQFIRKLMNESRRGALIQAFVIEALWRYADAVKRGGPAACDTAYLCGEAWHDCAVEVLEKMGVQYPAYVKSNEAEKKEGEG